MTIIAVAHTTTMARHAHHVVRVGMDGTIADQGRPERVLPRVDPTTGHLPKTTDDDLELAGRHEEALEIAHAYESAYLSLALGHIPDSPWVNKATPVGSQGAEAPELQPITTTVAPPLRFVSLHHIDPHELITTVRDWQRPRVPTALPPYMRQVVSNTWDDLHPPAEEDDGFDRWTARSTFLTELETAWADERLMKDAAGLAGPHREAAKLDIGLEP
jgi:hypothetical protein